MSPHDFRIGIIFAAFSLIALGAQALPKAAEQAGDSVTTVADVAKPRLSKNSAKKPEAKKPKTKRPATSPKKKTHAAAQR